MAAEPRAYYPGPLPAQALHAACGSDSRCGRAFHLCPAIGILSGATDVCTDVHMLMDLDARPRADTSAPPCIHAHSHAKERHIRTLPDRTHQTESPYPGGPSCSFCSKQINQPPCLRTTFGQCQSPQCALSIPASCPGVSPPPLPAPRALAPLIGPCSSAARDVPQLEENTYNLWSV